MGKRVVLTAPTNKALGVLKKIAEKNGIKNVGFCTIHQLLGLAPVRKGTEMVLKQVTPDSLHSYDILILDECSMISKELWEIVEEKIEGSLFGKKMLVMGDPAQLPPVSGDGEINEKKSLSFSVPNKAVLTQVVRQGIDSPLLEFVSSCRKSVKGKDVFQYFSLHSKDNTNGALIVSKETLLKYALKKFSESFDRDPDCFRILCYTNKSVDYWNSKIREHVYGNTERFVVGERLIARSPVLAPDGKTTILATSAEFEIVEINTDFYAGYSTWRLLVRTELNELRQIFVLHEDNLEKYKKDNSRLLKNAKSNPNLWKTWYEHNELFAQVRNCWALTVHNSQGSTFEEVGIDGKDIHIKSRGRNGSIRECNQLWYVATSRAKTRVIIAR